MKNKKGISDVVTTVLIVLLAVGAVAILGYFLLPMLTKSGGKITQAEACMSVSLEVTNCSATTTALTVERNAGAGSLKIIKFIFENPSGEKVVRNSTIVPDELGSKVYIAPYDPIIPAGFVLKKVSVAAGMADETGVLFYCNPIQAVSCL